MHDDEEGFLMGLLIGEGYFGGNRIQAEVNIKMHVRHRQTFYAVDGSRKGVAAGSVAERKRHALKSICAKRYR
jgi:hypothetical protein